MPALSELPLSDSFSLALRVYITHRYANFFLPLFLNPPPPLKPRHPEIATLNGTGKTINPDEKTPQNANMSVVFPTLTQKSRYSGKI